MVLLLNIILWNVICVHDKEQTQGLLYGKKVHTCTHVWIYLYVCTCIYLYFFLAMLYRIFNLDILPDILLIYLLLNIYWCIYFTYKCVCVCVCLCECVQALDPWNWSYRLLLPDVVQGTEPASSLRAVNVLGCWDIAPAHSGRFLFCRFQGWWELLP